MRISTQQIFQNGLQRMQDTSVQQSKTQEQLSTGKRVNRPSDDPVAASRILQLNQELARTEQYQRNIDFAENRLEQEDSTLASVNDVLVRVRELTVQAGNGSLTKEDRGYIAAELRQRLDQLAGLGNSQDSNGQHVFGGFDGANAPYQKDVEGNWQYGGDEGQRLLEIDSGVKVPISDNGKRIFENVPAVQAFSGASGDGKTVLAGSVGNLSDYTGELPVNVSIEFTDGPLGDLQYTIYDEKADPRTALIVDKPFEPGAENAAAGIHFKVGGPVAAGNTFSVEPVPKQGTLTTVEQLIDGLESYEATPAGKVAFDHVVSSALGNLDNAQSRILEVRAEVGARLNTVESTRDFLADSALLTEGVLSEVRDLDYAEAISRFTQQNTVLQAAQQSFARVSQLSLFDRL